MGQVPVHGSDRAEKLTSSDFTGLNYTVLGSFKLILHWNKYKYEHESIVSCKLKLSDIVRIFWSELSWMKWRRKSVKKHNSFNFRVPASVGLRPAFVSYHNSSYKVPNTASCDMKVGCLSAGHGSLQRLLKWFFLIETRIGWEFTGIADDIIVTERRPQYGQAFVSCNF